MASLNAEFLNKRDGAALFSKLRMKDILDRALIDKFLYKADHADVMAPRILGDEPSL